jgi:hypothetical protein
MIDDDYVIGELCRSHLQAELLLHGGIKARGCLGVIGRRGHYTAGTLETRGDEFAILQDANGFLLALMFDKHITPEHGYPGFFHVGFLQDSRGSVDERHTAVAAAGYDGPTPAMLQRGGPPTYGFYCNAPGGVTVEVSTMNV